MCGVAPAPAVPDGSGPPAGGADHHVLLSRQLVERAPGVSFSGEVMSDQRSVFTFTAASGSDVVEIVPAQLLHEVPGHHPLPVPPAPDLLVELGLVGLVVRHAVNQREHFKAAVLARLLQTDPESFQSEQLDCQDGSSLRNNFLKKIIILTCLSLLSHQCWSMISTGFTLAFPVRKWAWNYF